MLRADVTSEVYSTHDKHLVVISCTGMLSVFISISDAPLENDHSDCNIVWQGRMKTLKGGLNRDPVKYH